MTRRFGFTLIELLIVVAIIAILAAIAVPNFLEAQTRAKVSRTKADMRTMTTGIESYFIDHNQYPPVFVPTVWKPSSIGPSVFNTGDDGVSARLIPLTTPISYITSVLPEVFAVNGVAASDISTTQIYYDTFDFVIASELQPLGYTHNGRGSALTSGGAWRLASVGPDRYAAYGGRDSDSGDTTVNQRGCDYDPTNGTVSAGDIVRVGSVAPHPDDNPPYYNRAAGYGQN
jgi:prepilin-type N-terminal cleavage/methylation domain-containing protein